MVGQLPLEQLILGSSPSLATFYRVKQAMSSNLKKILIIILVLVATSLLLSNSANPGTPFFGIKRLQEKVFLSFSLAPEKKADYYLSLLDKRLEEINYLIKNKKTDHLWSASLRYSATAGEISKLIIDNNLISYASKAIEKFKSHQKAFKNLDDTFPNRFNNEDWKYLQDGVNYLDQYISQLSKVQR